AEIQCERSGKERERERERERGGKTKKKQERKKNEEGDLSARGADNHLRALVPNSSNRRQERRRILGKRRGGGFSLCYFLLACCLLVVVFIPLQGQRGKQWEIFQPRLVVNLFLHQTVKRRKRR